MMTTILAKSLARLVAVGDVNYKVVMTTTGLRISAQRKRQGVEVPWSSLVSLIETYGRAGTEPRAASPAGVPRAVTHDVAREVRSAAAALDRAEEAFKSAGVLPPEV